MWAAVETAFGSIISLVGTFLTALTTSAGALYPLLALFAVGIAISLVMVAVKINIGLAGSRVPVAIA